MANSTLEQVKIDDETSKPNDATKSPGVSVGTEITKIQLQYAINILKVAGLFIFLIGLVVAWLYLQAYSMTPPALSNKDLMTEYLKLLETRQKFIDSLFDNLIVKAILPITTAVIGFIIGTSRND